MRVVFSNLKGGVAKTTMSLHFAHYLAREGYRVLLVDADPQATITGAFGFIPDLDLNEGDDLFPALTDAPTRLEAAIKHTHWDNLDLIPVSYTHLDVYKRQAVRSIDDLVTRNAA